MGYRHITNAGNLGNFCEEVAVVLQLVVQPELPPKELRKMSMRPCTNCQWVKRFSAYVTWTENNGIIIWRPLWKSLMLLNHSSNKFLATPWVQAIPCNRVTLVNLKIEIDLRKFWLFSPSWIPMTVLTSRMARTEALRMIGGGMRME